VIAPGQGTVGATQIDTAYALWNKSGSDITYTAGNVGIGVTPSAWSGYTALQIGTRASLATTGAATSVVQNAYNNGTNWIYLANSYASRYNQVSGQHEWYYAVSGTAGNTATFTQAMTLDSSGNLGIGTASPTTKLSVRGTASMAYGNASASFSDNVTGTLYVLHSSGQVFVSSDTAFAFGSGPSATERMRIESGGNINLNSVVYGNTTVNAANMFLNSGPTHQIYRSTSSIRYKKDVETIENSYSEALLQCRPVWFRSSCSGDNKDYGYWGFIAEEVAEIDPRLVFLTTTETIQNEDGESVTVNLEKPRVDGVQYDRFVPHLLNLIKKQNETLTQQAETINALTARIETLEGK
jgi:hypothetical protein